MKKLLLLLFWAVCSLSYAQEQIVMTIGGTDVPLSDFLYFMEKNKSERDLDSEQLEEYKELFVNYKLKVKAAQAAGIDTTAAFLEEFSQYRSLIAEDYLVDTLFLEQEARYTYQLSADEVGPDGIAGIRLITVALKDTTSAAVSHAMERMDSICGLLVGGADFQLTARRFSDDESSIDGGYVGAFSKRQLEQIDATLAHAAFNTPVGRVSAPFYLDGAGFTVLKVDVRNPFGGYEQHRESIYRWMREHGIYEDAKRKRAVDYARRQGWSLTPDQALARLDSLLEQVEPDFRHISDEYHDGLLLFEISNREVWSRASTDTVGLDRFFAKNRKNYSFKQPRLEGYFFLCKDKKGFKTVKAKLKGLPMSDWNSAIQELNTPNMVVRALRGPIEKGRNTLVDKYVFGVDTLTVKPLPDFPYMDYVGKTLDSPDKWTQIPSVVISDYQTFLEQEWLKKLRKKYPVRINESVMESILQR